MDSFLRAALYECQHSLDRLLAAQIGTKPEKIAALREIEQTAKRMADGIERRLNQEVE